MVILQLYIKLILKSQQLYYSNNLGDLIEENTPTINGKIKYLAVNNAQDLQ